MPRAIKRLNLEGIFSLIYHKGVLRYMVQEMYLGVHMASSKAICLVSPRAKGIMRDLRLSNGWEVLRLRIL